jgi:hypothetical protein
MNEKFQQALIDHDFEVYDEIMTWLEEFQERDSGDIKDRIFMLITIVHIFCPSQNEIAGEHYLRHEQKSA